MFQLDSYGQKEREQDGEYTGRNWEILRKLQWCEGMRIKMTWSTTTNTMTKNWLLGVVDTDTDTDRKRKGMSKSLQLNCCDRWYQGNQLQRESQIFYSHTFSNVVNEIWPKSTASMCLYTRQWLSM